MVCAMANASEATGHQLGEYQLNYQMNDCQTNNGCQVVLVPMAPVAWQPNEADPGADVASCGLPFVQVVWAQPVPYIDYTGGYPQMEAGSQQQYCMVAMPAAQSNYYADSAYAESEAPTGDEEATSCSLDAYDAYGQSAISTSTARRQRRQRASERAAGRARAGAAVQARQACAGQLATVSEASTSDGEDSPVSGLEATGLRKLTEDLAAGCDARSAAVAALTGSVWRFSRDPLGCRVVQLALEVATASEAKALVSELHGHVEQAIYSPHANYVIQKVIEAMPAPVSRFIAQELAGTAGLIVRHRFGCRVFCRLLEHGGGDCDATTAVVNECLVDAEELCRHTFGHYVAKTILEHGSPEQKARLCRALYAGPAAGQVPGGSLAGLTRNALHRNASYVLERAIAHCSAEDAGALGRALLCNGSLVALGQSPFGSHVVKALLRNPQMEQAAYAQIVANMEILRPTKYGNKLLEEVGLGQQRRQ